MMGPGGDFQNLQEEETNTKSIKPLDCYIKPSEIGFYTELAF